VVFERADRLGGLLRYGIPEFKLEKRHLNRRIEQMRAEGTEFRTSVSVGEDVMDLRAEFDALVLAGGAMAWRDLPIPGRELRGIYQAMDNTECFVGDDAGNVREQSGSDASPSARSRGRCSIACHG